MAEMLDAETRGRSASRWELDISPIRSLIESLPAGGPVDADLAERLMSAIRVHDVGGITATMIAPYGGRSRMIGRSVGQFWPSESHPVVAELIIAVVNDRPSHAPRSRKVTSLLLKDAELTVRLKKGAPEIVAVAVTGLVYDGRSRWALKASEDRYRKLIHHMPMPLLQVDAKALVRIFDRLRSEGVLNLGDYLDGHPELARQAREVIEFTDANPSAVALIGGAEPGDVLNRVDELFLLSPEVIRRVMIALFDGRRSHTEMIKLRTLDHRLLDVKVTATFPTRPERLDVTLLTLDDMTERLRTEAQLRQFQADYTRAARISTLGELATSIAHEVSQPLSAIVTNAETSLRWLSRDEPNLAKVDQLTRRIAESAHRAHEIVQRIRGMAARHEPQRILLDINEVIDEALLFTRHDLESRSITLSLERAPGLPSVWGDKVQLQQVIVNLLLNSIQAIGQDALHGRVELRTALDGSDVVAIAVRDNGHGIAAENLERVFEGFFTTKDDGIGIGLAICYSIIVGHGGRIAASNHPDGGALFEIRLPAARALAES